LTPLVFGYMIYDRCIFNTMPGRNIPLVTDQIYHVVNRGVASTPVFLNKKDYLRAQETILYYQNQSPSLSYSHFLRLPIKQKSEILEILNEKGEFLVDIIALCLMPNHIHLLLKQNQERGISIFMSNLTNSYTRYFNKRNERIGPLFQGKFKAVRIESDEQLLHVSRYIHLNPFTSFIVKTLKDLEVYPYSSLPEYLRYSKTNFFQKEIVLGQFKSRSSYKMFIFNQAEYQRQLERIKHLILE